MKIKEFLKTLIHNKTLWYFLFLFISVSVILFFTKGLFECFSVLSENFGYPYYSFSKFIPHNSILQIFTSSDHGWVIFSIFHVLSLRYLPQILNIHPQVCMEQYTVFFLFFIFICFLYCLAENLFKYNKNKIYTPISILLVYPLFFLLLYNAKFYWIFHSSCWIFCYFLLPLFPLLLMNQFEYFYVTQEPIPRKQIKIFILLTICTAVSQEFFRIVLILALLLGLFLQRIIFKKKLSIEILRNSFFFIITNSLLFFTDTFNSIFHRRCDAISTINVKTYIINFLTDYKSYFIEKNTVLFITLFVSWFFIFSFIKNKETNKRFFIYSVSILISTLLFILMTAISVDYDGINQEILSHSGLRFIFSIILLNLIFSAIGYINKYKETIIDKINMTLIIFSILFIVIITNAKDIFYFKNEYNISKFFRENTYILEKVYLLNKKENNNNIIYTYCDTNISQALIYRGIDQYLINTYKKYGKTEDYEMYSVCDNNDETLYDLRAKMLKLSEEKLHYKITEEEIEKHDFAKLYELE